MVAVVAPGAPAEVPAPAQVSASPLSGGTSGAAYFDEADVDGVSAPVQDELTGSWSPSYSAGD